MVNNKYLKQKPVQLVEQMIALRMSFPSARCEIIKGKLWWLGKIKPSPLSKEYTVLMTYKMWEVPQVWVVGNELECLDSCDFPHYYEIKEKDEMVRICLYRYDEFSPYKVLSKTIVPWIVEWLYFYEIWLATGEWCGGGQHPCDVKI